MNWLERYIEAVKRCLPRARREDLGEELHSLLQERLEDAAKSQGRPPSEEEVLALLKEFGHPLEVAGRYGRQGPLVSESLLPIYKRVLKYLLLAFVAVQVGSAVLSISGPSWWPAGLSDQINTIALWWFVLITLAFVLADDLILRLDLLGHWNPRRLPAVERGRPISLFDSLVNLFALLLMFAIFSAFHDTFDWQTLVGQVEEPWATVVLWCKIQILLSMGLNLAALFRPYWSRSKIVFKMGTDAMLAGIAAWALTIPGIWGPFRLMITGFLVLNVLGVVDKIRRLVQFNTPARDKGAGWVKRHLLRQAKDSLPAEFGEDLKTQVEADLERGRMSSRDSRR